MSVAIRHGRSSVATEDRIFFVYTQLKKIRAGETEKQTFDELGRVASEKFPGGVQINTRFVKRIAMAVEKGITVKTLDDIKDERLNLPWARKGTIWAQTWEPQSTKRTISLASPAPQAKIVRNETTLEAVRAATTTLPSELRDLLGRAGKLMERHKLQKLELAVGADGLYVSAHTMPLTIFDRI